jgi:hypothetical protein
MNIPSLNELVAVIVTAVVLTFASGHGDQIWKVLGELRRTALVSARQDWGCPSLTGRSACTSYDPARYR